MADQTSLILTYKGKLLLFSYDVSFDKNDNIWDFLKLGNRTEKSIAAYLSEELNIVTDSNQRFETVSEIITASNETVRLLHFKLTDKHVNGLIRKDRWRLEFYRLSEIKSISLSDEASAFLCSHNETIKNLLDG